MSTKREITGIVRRAAGGEPWPRARVLFRLLSDPATRAEEILPVSSRVFYSLADGSLPEDCALETPDEDAWEYELIIGSNEPLRFFLERGDGSPLTIDQVIALADVPGSEAGTPANSWWVAVYSGSLEADEGAVLAADGSWGGLTLAGLAAVSDLLPIIDPGVAGEWWNDDGVVKISQGGGE
jgi:hypothetical protein